MLFSEAKEGAFCSEVWPGPAPFSEVETRNIRDYVSKLCPTPILTLALHSAAELIMFPYSFNASKYPENWEEMVS